MNFLNKDIYIYSDRQEAALSGGIRRLSANPNEAELENLVITLGNNSDLLNGEHFQKLAPIWKALKQKYKATARQRQAQLAAQKKAQIAEARKQTRLAAVQKRLQVRAERARIAAQKRLQAIAAKTRHH